MATSSKSSVKSRKMSRTITTALAYAVLEWLLICMLFVNAIFWYLITKFANHYELQAPCLLCSRLDHILGKKKWKYCWDLICLNHKSEISSLVLCHAHNNLVNVQGMCENCLFSFATINKSNTETYRLLVGKLGEDSSFGLDQDPVLDSYNTSTRNCSCCNEPWVPRSCGQKLMQTTSVGSEATDIYVEGPAEHQHSTQSNGNGLDPPPHVGFSKLKTSSGDLSEVNFSDDGQAKVLLSENAPKEFQLLEPHIITLPDDLASEKQINQVPPSEPLISFSQVQSDLGTHTVPCSTCTAAAGNGLDGIDLHQKNLRINATAIPEFSPLYDVSVTPNNSPVEGLKESNLIVLEDACPLSFPTIPSKESEIISTDNDSSLAKATDIHIETSEDGKSISHFDFTASSNTRPRDEETSTESKLISLVDVIPSSHLEESQAHGLNESGVAKSEEAPNILVIDSRETLKAADSRLSTMTTMAPEVNPVSVDNTQQGTNLLDLSDAYKLAVGNRGRQLSGALAEQWLAKDSSRISEDLKLLLSQLSAAREQSMPDLSPRVPMSPRFPMSPKLSLNSEDCKTSDASNAIGIQLLQKRLERNESSLSLDGSIVSEIEGESAVDRLKRQVEHDKKLLNALYKELEEERSASAIAANQAMAMITRLQEEKASLHMEALQCLRMMEEQAEYDMEALQNTNDLLAEKEKELQDLEAELEYYREKYPNELMIENTAEQVSGTKTSIEIDWSETTQVDARTSNFRNLIDFEDERSHILQSLKMLEKKLHLFSNHGLPIEFANSQCCGNDCDTEMQLKELHNKLGYVLNTSLEDNDSSTQNNKDGEPQGQIFSPEKHELSGKENIEIFFSGQSSPHPISGSELDALTKEVSDLNERLKALDAYRAFMEHTVKSIRHGEEGLQLVQEIASHLKELRRIGLRINNKVDRSCAKNTPAFKR